MANLQTSTAHSSLDIPSTSTSTSTRYFDVFISHRGPDVKNTFATHLYRQLSEHGLQSFFDREELQAGKVLSPQIECAISAAYIHIVIFSPGFADSEWCLNELVHISNKSEDTIIPVFYKVKPSEVRWTETGTGQYAQALTNHEQKGRYNRQTIESWRKALKDVSYRVGFEHEANGDEGKLLDNVVRCALQNRRKIGLHVARYPTGLEEKLEDFEKTLSLQHQSGEVKVMGIVGMGGVGKTTLAKALFNKKSANFGESCYLRDVREEANAGRSLNSLQTKLIKDLAHRDVLIDNVDEGIEKLKTYVTSKHALVVLDDVDDGDQLDALFLPIMEVLHSNSLILVTSRYKDVLTRSGIVGSSMYNLTGLNEEHSQELFCSHAFFDPCPPPGFKDLVGKFCRACHGLPLSLKVYGGLLCGKDESYWESVLDELRQIKLPNEIRKTLRLSYDALEEEEKQIFLDIACFFIGEDRDMAIRIWDGTGWKGLVGFVNLESRCLVEVERENDTIRMHDHLRDLGREIAENSEVIQRRLWRQMEDIHDLWKESTVITEVRGIRTVPGQMYCSDIQNSEEKVSWLKSRSKDVLENWWRLIDTTSYSFRKLQLLVAEDDDLTSILKRVKSPDLIWLRWNNCPFSCLPSWIPMKNIRVLEVMGKKLKTLWLTAYQAPLELRELYIGAPLSKFPESIGRLKHIEKIVVEKSNLKSLPEEFCELRSLKYLCLYGADLVSLPCSFGKLTNLRHLKLVSCRSLLWLPDSFSCLENLQILNLSACSNLQLLPFFFEEMTNLEDLDLSLCSSLQMFSELKGFLGNLRRLNVSDCPLDGNLGEPVMNYSRLISEVMSVRGQMREKRQIRLYESRISGQMLIRQVMETREIRLLADSQIRKLRNLLIRKLIEGEFQNCYRHGISELIEKEIRELIEGEF